MYHNEEQIRYVSQFELLTDQKPWLPEEYLEIDHS
jgi:hypothetical protein